MNICVMCGENVSDCRHACQSCERKAGEMELNALRIERDYWKGKAEEKQRTLDKVRIFIKQNRTNKGY